MVNANEYAALAVRYSREYAERSMARILDACPAGTDRKKAEDFIKTWYIENGHLFSSIYKDVFRKHLEMQFQAKASGRKPIFSCFSGPFGAGKTTLQALLDSENVPASLQHIQAIQLYRASMPFQFEFDWAWKEIGLQLGIYDPNDHQRTFWKVRAAGAGCKDAAMELAVAEGLDLLYPASLTPHINDGQATLDNEVARLHSYKDKGYDFVLIGCAASLKTCFERILQRDRKPSPEEVIKSIEGFNQHYPLFAEMAHRSVLVDTGMKGDYSILDPEQVLL